MTDDDAIVRLLATARADDAARSRACIAALRDSGAEDATVAGILADLSDDRRRARLVVRGETVTGVVERAGREGVVLHGSGVQTFVRTAAVELVRCVGRTRLEGDGRAVDGPSWSTLLHEHLERGDEVLVLAGGMRLRGEVVSVGRSVVVLTAPDGATDYVRTDAIDAVSVESSTSSA